MLLKPGSCGGYWLGAGVGVGPMSPDPGGAWLNCPGSNAGELVLLNGGALVPKKSETFNLIFICYHFRIRTHSFKISSRQRQKLGITLKELWRESENYTE